MSTGFRSPIGRARDAIAALGRSLAAVLGRLGIFGSAVLLLALVAIAQLLPAPAFWFPTLGVVSVESPEVYTRERLVNDRYRQDFWLKDQLDRLDRASQFIGEQQLSAVSVGAGTDLAAFSAVDDVSLAFQDEFLLRLATRDRIRQLILENLLDDRHDLTGNSIYGLKFDTAVLPGRNTHDRPFVRVWLDYTPFRGDGQEELRAEDYLATRHLYVSDATRDPFASATRQFDGWMRDLKGRLNRNLEARLAAGGECARTLPESDDPITVVDSFKLAPPFLDASFAPRRAADAPELSFSGPPEIDDDDRACIKDVLRFVMGIHPREIEIGDLKPDENSILIELPDPWRNYFSLDLVIREIPGETYVFFNLRPHQVQFLLVSGEQWSAYHEARAAPEGEPAPPAQAESATANDRYWVVKRSVVQQAPDAPGGEVVLLVESDSGQSNAQLMILSRLTRSEVEALSRAESDVTCLEPGDPVRGESGCLLTGRTVLLNTSLYNFIKAVSRIDAYSYAVFPRGDVTGVLTSEMLSARADTGEGGLSGLGALSGKLSAGAQVKVLNFVGDDPPPDTGTGGGANTFSFGWAVVKDGRQVPDVVSQLVLVSVPAYLDRVELTVQTGWIGRDSRPIERTTQTRYMTVVLPPDFEALDTLVIGGTRRQGPVVDETLLSDDLVLRACARSSLVIPGERLWRSTTVTLGGQVADQITVMPNMQGIVATFDPVELPPTGDSSSAVEVAADVMIWTSEGVIGLEDQATIRVAGGLAGQGDCPAPAPQGATARP